jgi:hypothetical protein
VKESDPRRADSYDQGVLVVLYLRYKRTGKNLPASLAPAPSPAMLHPVLEPVPVPVARGLRRIGNNVLNPACALACNTLLPPRDAPAPARYCVHWPRSMTAPACGVYCDGAQVCKVYEVCI